MWDGRYGMCAQKGEMKIDLCDLDMLAQCKN